MEEVITDVHSSTSNHYSPTNSDKQLRSDTYSILAALLSNTPSQDLIDYLTHIEPSSSEDIGDMGKAWQALRVAASKVQLNELDGEYHTLFIGVGRGVIVPFGSWHLTGFLMDKPLSDLRDDLKALGIEPNEGEKDPEDHIAALCETMALIINADDVDETRQRQFFMRHIHLWANKFFEELQTTDSAVFYKAVGLLGQEFLKLENQYLNIQAH